MEYKNVKGLATGADGSVFFQLREVFPDKTGLFASNKGFVQVEEILEAWGNDEKVAKSLDRQIKHSDITFEQLTKWKIANDDKKSAARKAGKSEREIQKMRF